MKGKQNLVIWNQSIMDSCGLDLDSWLTRSLPKKNIFTERSFPLFQTTEYILSKDDNCNTLIYTDLELVSKNYVSWSEFGLTVSMGITNYYKGVSVHFRVKEVFRAYPQAKLNIVTGSDITALYITLPKNTKIYVQRF